MDKLTNEPNPTSLFSSNTTFGRGWNIPRNDNEIPKWYEFHEERMSNWKNYGLQLSKFMHLQLHFILLGQKKKLNILKIIPQSGCEIPDLGKSPNQL